jgi:TPR repeat protein
MPEFRSTLAVNSLQPGCPFCGRDLSGLDAAIYCPACGQKIRRITPPSRVAKTVRAVFHFITLGRFKPIDPQAYTPGGTRILIGYGKAMFNLGWRYERGRGAIRNMPEAIRCYKKSAKLGNIDATVRLAVDEGAKPAQVTPVEGELAS